VPNQFRRNIVYIDQVTQVFAFKLPGLIVLLLEAISITILRLNVSFRISRNAKLNFRDFIRLSEGLKIGNI
jgi:hypothetical protein